MAPNFSQPHAAAVAVDDEQDALRSATCPMCHTSATLAQGATETGGAWRCIRCGQYWDAARLAAVAAYAAWTIDHDRIGLGASASQEPAPYRDPPAEAGLTASGRRR